MAACGLPWQNPPPGGSVAALPVVIAALNLTALVFLLLGRRAIRSGRADAHRRRMLSAFLVSGLFLAAYLAHALGSGTTYFQGAGWARAVYLAVLLTHMPLAASVPLLAGAAVVHAAAGRFDRHRRLVRWLYPIWLYVSVTGLLVYFMLHHWPAGHAIA